MSVIGCLAYDARMNQLVQFIFRLFLDREELDELSLGKIRGSISDKLFPGISVLQTRVGYMLFIPWLFNMNEKEVKKPGECAYTVPLVSQIRTCTKKLGVVLIQSLMSLYTLIHGKWKSRGVEVNTKHKLKNFPSEICWSGLKAKKICEEDGPLSNSYCSNYQQFDWDMAFNPYLEAVEDRPKRIKSFWSEKLPPKLKNLLRKENFELTNGIRLFLAPSGAKIVQQTEGIQC